MLRVWFINSNFKDALNRASVVPSHMSSPTQLMGIICLNVATVALAAAGVEADMSQHRLVFILADGTCPIWAVSSLRLLKVPFGWSGEPVPLRFFPLSTPTSFY
jgi:hypothetical protein